MTNDTTKTNQDDALDDQLVDRLIERLAESTDGQERERLLDEIEPEAFEAWLAERTRRKRLQAKLDRAARRHAALEAKRGRARIALALSGNEGDEDA